MLQLPVMSLAIPAKFFFFHFQGLFFNPSEYNKAKLIHEMFDDGLRSSSQDMVDPEKGPLLTIQQWSPSIIRNVTEPTLLNTVLLQVVHVMPLVIDGAVNKKEVMHELTVLAWDCIDVLDDTEDSEERLLLRRRSETKLCMVFNDFLCWSMIHCHREGHLTMIFPTEVYKNILDFSDKLVKQMQDFIDDGHQVTLGRDKQEQAFSQEEFDKARSLVVRVFELADWAFIEFCSRATQCCLRDISLLLTDDLAVVKPTVQSARLNLS